MIQTEPTAVSEQTVPYHQGVDSDPEAELFGGLSGTVLEIGPGYGESFAHLDRDIDWIGLEPRTSTFPSLRAKARRSVRSARLIEGVAEDIPLDDDSVDAVVSSLVLCSVDHQHRSLSEIRRVLKPGGRFVFVEHVAAPRGSVVRAGQRAWDLMFAHGRGACHPARDTLKAIEAQFETVDAGRFDLPGPFGVGIPHVAGTAYAEISMADGRAGAAPRATCAD